jgi:Leucine-rich repeat (LRR) protein
MYRICVLCFLLTACQNYDVTLNDRQVYGPTRLFTNFEVSDEALQRCIEQRIADENISALLQLKTLNCSNAGITSLSGLGQFAGLTQLKFSDNRIRNLVELGQLMGIESLWLDNNDIVDPVPLARLSKLSQLDLAGNAKLQCPKAGLLDTVAILTVPEHCRTASEKQDD